MPIVSERGCGGRLERAPLTGKKFGVPSAWADEVVVVAVMAGLSLM